MVFGEPDIEIRHGEDGTVTVEIRGVDVYDPTTGEVRSRRTDDIACWFIDTDYDGEAFFVRHAYFTAAADDPYDKLKRALKADIDEEAWASALLDDEPPVPAAGDGQDRRQGHQPLRRRGPEGVRGGLVPTPRPRLRVALQRRVAMEVHRVSLKNDKLVYVVLQDKKYQYPNGRSRVVYIGTTQNGVSRMAVSAAYRSEEIFAGWGVEKLEIRIVTCRPRRRVKTWIKLERALLLSFRDLYGVPPVSNSQGSRIRERDEFEYFSRSRLRRIFEDLA